MRKYVCAILLCSGLCSATPKGVIPSGAKFFISPMEGDLDGFIATEMIKQKIPVKITTDDKEAEYVLVGISLKGDDRWFNVIFGGKDKHEGNVRMLEVKTKQLVWAGEAGDRSLWLSGFRRGGQRKIAERIVNHMKSAHLFRN